MVGSRVLEGLLQAPEFARILAITRRPLGRDSQRLANRIVLFGQLEAQLKGQICDTALCCLGGSYREAGSEAAYREAVADLRARLRQSRTRSRCPPLRNVVLLHRQHAVAQSCGARTRAKPWTL